MPRRGWHRHGGIFHRIKSRVVDRLRRLREHKESDRRRRLHDIIRRHYNETSARADRLRFKYFDLRRMTRNTTHERARQNLIMTPMPIEPQFVAQSEVRLITHRLCKSSHPTYMNLVNALRYNPTQVYGIYLAANSYLNRLRRPMTFSTNRFTQYLSVAWEKFKRMVRLFVIKHAGQAYTIVAKVAGKIQSFLDSVRIRLSNMASYFEAKIYELAFMVRAVRRYFAIERGRRELVVDNSIKHCSAYAIVTGVPYKGWTSGWYYWRKRAKYCRNYCGNYEKEQRGICVQLCEQFLVQLDPDKWDYGKQVALNLVDSYMTKLTG